MKKKVKYRLVEINSTTIDFESGEVIEENPKFSVQYSYEESYWFGFVKKWTEWYEEYGGIGADFKTARFYYRRQIHKHKPDTITTKVLEESGIL